LGDAPLFTATVERDIFPEAEAEEGAVWLSVRVPSGDAVPLKERTEHETHADYFFDIPGYRTVTFSLWHNHFRYGLLPFVRTDDTIFGISSAGRLIDMEAPVPAFGFRGREEWGTYRGYIFSRSFPLMPAAWLIGSGPDTFINVFPQHDMVGKVQNFDRTPYHIVDKAHNLYIQTWITSGGVSALALVFLFGHFMYVTFMSLVRKQQGDTRFGYGLRLGLLAAAAAFCVASLATDSTVGSTGVFFVLLGLGYGVNNLLRN
jgi:hypothetical protein